jgi:hypothetical protein
MSPRRRKILHGAAQSAFIWLAIGACFEAWLLFDPRYHAAAVLPFCLLETAALLAALLMAAFS